MVRQRYLQKTTLENARQLFLEHPSAVRGTEIEARATADTLGYVTARAAFASISSPSFHCSAMDGVAVKAEDTFGASESQPVHLLADQYVPLDTGDPIPPNTDAVIMIEDVTEAGDGRIMLTSAATPWQHVRMVGEDVVASEMLLPRGHRLRAADIAVLLACGVQQVEIRKPPRVAIIPTGEELIDASSPLNELKQVGRIVESNSHLIGNLVTEWGGYAERLSIVPDIPVEIRQALKEAVAKSDIVAINAGSSAGRGDFVPAIIGELGDLLVHGVEIMPGKPVSLGIIDDTPVIGVPGYPVSAYVVCEEFLRPLIARKLGIALPSRERVPATMGRRTPSRLGSEEYVRVRIGDVEGRRVVLPLGRGASLLNSVVRADGVMRIPSNSEGVEQGEPVAVDLFGASDEIASRILAIGSHDILLDLLADEIRSTHPEISVSSAHVGSLAGLTALKRQETHLAGVHLLDEKTGEYNVSYAQRFFPQGGIALVNLAYREQGLLVPPGNPKEIHTLDDLARDDLIFINRQRGSGTRVLLDYQLRKRQITPQQIQGYDRELYTHLAIAAAVESGAADVGLGILAVARALGLEFVPVAEERYDLAMRTETLELPHIEELLALLTRESFQQSVAGIGGYDLRDTGRRFL